MEQETLRSLRANRLESITVTKRPHCRVDGVDQHPSLSFDLFMYVVAFVVSLYSHIRTDDTHTQSHTI